MTDYNWKSCADPANAARLRELLEAGRKVIISRFGDVVHLTWRAQTWLEKLDKAQWLFLDPDEPAPIRPHTCECVCGCTEPTNDELCADCHVRNIRGDKCQTMRARILGLEYGV